MKNKPLKHWTWEELIDECTWIIIQSLIRAGTIRSGVLDVFNLISNWFEETGKFKK